MSKNEIMAKASRACHTSLLQLKKHSPKILVIAGVVGTVASTVMACKATLKATEVIEAHKDNVENSTRQLKTILRNILRRTCRRT